jgi:hypothetical protein
MRLSDPFVARLSASVPPETSDFGRLRIDQFSHDGAPPRLPDARADPSNAYSKHSEVFTKIWQHCLEHLGVYAGRGTVIQINPSHPLKLTASGLLKKAMRLLELVSYHPSLNESLL